ncbi:MAG: hypothetical protein NVSMB38_07490 [Ktedonobacteraceae bacterium]
MCWHSQGYDVGNPYKPCHYYTVRHTVAKPRDSVYSSDRACPCHAPLDVLLWGLQ